MNASQPLLGLSSRFLQCARIALPSTLMLAASACGPLPEDGEVAEASVTAQRVDSLDGDECAAGGCTTVVLNPVADAHVRYAEPNRNFGTWLEFVVAPAWRGDVWMQEESFLRFDFASLPANARIVSAKLSATAYTGFAWGGDGNVYTHLVQDDSWSETGLTWNNKPAISGAHVGYWWLWYGYSGHTELLGVNESPELASVANTELARDRKLSLRLHSPGYVTKYRSREFPDATRRPKLELTYSVPRTCEEPGEPTLVLNGPSQLTLECGVSTWTDPGAQASDACGPLRVHTYNSGKDAYGPGPNTRAEGSYSVQYIAWNSEGTTVSAIRTVNVEDRRAPSLALNGAARMTHTCGSQWVDPGVVALDACYGDVSATVRRTGEVNGWVAGTYTVSYAVTDSGGNSAAPVTRTVQVANCPW